jgi:hypothetical protein
MSINFFEKFYLKSGLDKNKKLIFTKHLGELKNPNKSFRFYLELFLNKILYLFLIFQKKKYLNN